MGGLKKPERFSANREIFLLRLFCSRLTAAGTQRRIPDCYYSAFGFVVTRGRGFHPPPRESAASMVATPLHGEIAPFRLISPPMKFPPQAVIGGSSPRTVFPPAPSVLPGGKTARKENFIWSSALPPEIFWSGPSCPASAENMPKGIFSGRFGPSRRTRRRCGFQSRGDPLDNPPLTPFPGDSSRGG